MTLIAPLWPEMSLFADLLFLLTLPPWDRLLRQPHFHRFHGVIHTLNLHVWRLSSVSSESQDFETSFAPVFPMCQRVYCTLLPVAMALLLWLVSWKERYSDRRH